MSKSQAAESSTSTHSVVVSKEGAAMRVERIELSPAARRSLTTGVKYVGSRNGGDGGSAKRPTK